MLVAQVCGHEPGVRGEVCATVVTMVGHILTGNLSRGKAGQELKAEDKSAFLGGEFEGRCAYGSSAICCRWDILVTLQWRRRLLGRVLERE